VGEIEALKKKQDLKTEGLYKVVRHPMYMLSLMAFFMTPLMTWDRFLWSMMSLVYFVVAIPIEEIQLVEEFGPKYLDYQEQVQALVPFRYPLRATKTSPKAK